MERGYYYAYIMGNFRPTMYVGVTNDLLRRVDEHQNNINTKSFTAKYGLNKLLYCQLIDDPDPMTAIIREKQIKNMSRKEKLNLVRTINPKFQDIFDEVKENF